MTAQLTLEQIQALAQQDMQAVDQEILAQLNSEVPLINQLGHYIISGGVLYCIEKYHDSAINT
ncbi:hypothetical protein RZ62_02785 [[Haemophilus] ducreyi]|nr:hypothetical protein RZ62_02785 [[Haemophilus] ducreyi]